MTEKKTGKLFQLRNSAYSLLELFHDNQIYVFWQVDKLDIWALSAD